MNVFEAIQARQSVRAYQAREVEPEKLQGVLSAANQAPSAGNLQAYQVYLVREDSVKRALAQAALEQTFLIQAPVVLVFCTVAARAARYGQRGERLYALQDATVATAYAQLAATAQGLAPAPAAGRPPAGRPPAARLCGGDPEPQPAALPGRPGDVPVSQG
jgi:nitroreductase